MLKSHIAFFALSGVVCIGCEPPNGRFNLPPNGITTDMPSDKLPRKVPIQLNQLNCTLGKNIPKDISTNLPMTPTPPPAPMIQFTKTNTIQSAAVDCSNALGSAYLEYNCTIPKPMLVDNNSGFGSAKVYALQIGRIDQCRSVNSVGAFHDCVTTVSISLEDPVAPQQILFQSSPIIEQNTSGRTAILDPIIGNWIPGKALSTAGAKLTIATRIQCMDKASKLNTPFSFALSELEMTADPVLTSP